MVECGHTDPALHPKVSNLPQRTAALGVRDPALWLPLAISSSLMVTEASTGSLQVPPKWRLPSTRSGFVCLL